MTKDREKISDKQIQVNDSRLRIAPYVPALSNKQNPPKEEYPAKHRKGD